MLSLFLCTFLFAADPTAGAVNQAQVDDLVSKLDDDSKAVRTQAEKDLIKLGPAALPFLPPPGALPNVEALGHIRKALQGAAAQASIEASTVTLHGRMKLSRVLAEIEKQTSNKIIAMPQPAEVPAADPEIKIDFEKTPFWTALDEVLDKAQLSIYPYGQPGALQLVPRGPQTMPRAGHAAVVGPLRIEPVRVTAIRDLRSTTPASLQIALEVAWEPRLRPIAIKQRAADLKAIDSSGAVLASDDPEAEKEGIPRPGSSALEMDVSLAMPAAGVKEIASLQGSFQVMMLGRLETFKFNDLLKANPQGKPRKQRIAAATVTLTNIRKNGEVWEVYAQLGYDEAGDAFESHRNWALQNKAYLEDAGGAAIEPDSIETTLRTPTEIGVGYVFALDNGKSPEKMTFVYKTPGLIATKDFRYELKGIKLP